METQSFMNRTHLNFLDIKSQNSANVYNQLIWCVDAMPVVFVFMSYLKVYIQTQI